MSTRSRATKGVAGAEPRKNGAEADVESPNPGIVSIEELAQIAQEVTLENRVYVRRLAAKDAEIEGLKAKLAERDTSS